MESFEINWEHLALIISGAKLWSKLSESGKDYESVRLANKSLELIKAWKNEEAWQAFEAMLTYIDSTIKLDTQEAFFLKRIRNETIHETNNLLN